MAKQKIQDFITAKPRYKWNFQNVGGTPRVNIQSGEDIRHLAELDQKMWTILSCPVSGLEIDAQSLAMMDTDKDGKIHVQDIINTANWLCEALQDPDILLQRSSSLPLQSINQNTDTGRMLYQSALQIVRNLGKEKEELSVADTDNSVAIFATTRFNGDGVITDHSSDDPALQSTISAIVQTTGGTMDRSGVLGVNADQINRFYDNLNAYLAWAKAKPELPFGANTDALIDTYNLLNDKVQDFFMRNRLAAFNQASAPALDIQNARIEAISDSNLASKIDEIATYPLAHINGKEELDLDGPLNPAWHDALDKLRQCDFLTDMEHLITPESWARLAADFAPYLAWKNAKAGAEVEILGEAQIEALLQANQKDQLLDLVKQDQALETEAAHIEEVHKLLHLCRDFGTLLRNFVTLQDFYDRDPNHQAIFQAGRLVIDQRECRLCMQVTDMAKHNAMAAASGLYLIYCNCTRQGYAGTLSIVAAMTMGDIGDLMVGKNAIFYDRQNRDWDAVITKIIENPISISQAFWSPYRRLAKWVENLINKNASERDAKMMSETTAKLAEKPTLPADGAKPAPAQPFDIAKFAGIFAALGMALGMIGSFFVSLAKGFVALKWWQGILAIIAILLLISGPSMIMAWLKLRRRNIAPLLNANGWAVNASSTISIPFGATLTDQAKFPKLNLQDPYAKKGVPAWKKWLYSILFVIVVVVVLWLCNLLNWAKLPSPLPCFNKVTTEAPASDPAPADSVATVAVEPAVDAAE